MEQVEVDPPGDNHLPPPTPPPPTSPCPFDVDQQQGAPPGDTIRVFVNGSRRKGDGYLVRKELLVGASPVFEYLVRRMESAGEEEAGHFAMILDIQPDAFQLMGKLLQTSAVPTGSSKFNTESALQLLDACFRFGMPEKGLLVADQLGKLSTNIIRAEHAIHVLSMARRYNLSGLEESALKVILEHAKLILSGDEFLQLGSYDVVRILSHDGLQATEAQVFDAALRWAISISTGSNNFKRTLEYNFSKVFPCIRFPLMSAAELATKTQEAPLDVFRQVEPTQLVNLFCYVSLPPSLKSRRGPSLLNMFSCTPRKPLEQPSPKIIIEQDISESESTTKKTSSSSSSSLIRSKKSVTFTSPSTSTTARRRGRPPKRPLLASASHNPTNSKRKIDRKMLIPENNGHNNSSESDSDFFTPVVKVKVSNGRFEVFEDAARKYLQRTQTDTDPNLEGSMIITDVTLAHNHRPLDVQEDVAKKIVVNVRCNFIHDGSGREEENDDDEDDDEDEDDDKMSNFLNFVKTFDPMRYLVTGATYLSIEDAWSSPSSSLAESELLLKFNGVTFLKLTPEPDSELTLNYMSSSLKILSSEKTHPAKLALSNCEFSTEALLKGGDRGKGLKSLTLYRAWGSFNLNEMLEDFPNLSELVCWKHLPRRWPPPGTDDTDRDSTLEPLYLDFTSSSGGFAARHTLRRLVLYQAELKFPTKGSHDGMVETSVEELRLDKCYCKTSSPSSSQLSDVIHLVFPRLQRLMLLEADHDGDLATPKVVTRAADRIRTIQWIRIVGMKWTSMKRKKGKKQRLDTSSSEEDNELRQLLKESGLKANNNPTNFLLERSEGGGGGTWKGTGMNEGEEDIWKLEVGGFWDSMDELEYRWYNLNCFYESVATFQDYFLQDADGGEANDGGGEEDVGFPKPILWC